MLARSWQQIAELLEAAARFRLAQWKCGFPRFDSLPDEALDLAVSAWCMELAKDMVGPLEPPQEVKPWILARLVTASVEARAETAAGSPVPAVTPAFLKDVLIASWHQQLRERWNLMVTVDLDAWHAE